MFNLLGAVAPGIFRAYCIATSCRLGTELIHFHPVKHNRHSRIPASASKPQILRSHEPGKIDDTSCIVATAGLARRLPLNFSKTLNDIEANLLLHFCALRQEIYIVVLCICTRSLPSSLPWQKPMEPNYFLNICLGPVARACDRLTHHKFRTFRI